MNTTIRYVLRGTLLCALCGALGATLLVATPAHAGRAAYWAAMLPLIDAHQAKLLEADYAAGKLKLDEDAAKQLSKAYIAARTSYERALAKTEKELADMEGDRAVRRAASREAYAKVTASEQGKFKEALLAFLTKEQAAETLKLLGTFSSQMDYMFYLVSGYNLGDSQDKALELVVGYIVAEEKLRGQAPVEGLSSDDRREKSRALKEKLDKSLAAMLSEEQMLRWTKLTTRQRGGGAQREGAERRDGGEQEKPEEPASSDDQQKAEEPASSDKGE